MAKQLRQITINVDAGQATNALNSVARSMGGISKNTKDLAQGFGFLGNATTSFIGGLSIKTLSGFSDEITSLNNRLLALTGSQDEATDTLNRLTSVSRETNQSVVSVTDSYLRMSIVLRDLGVSGNVLIDMTKTIANTFRLSGATAEEASNATVQLGQAFSLGVLRGQDLRSIMSQNLVLTKLLRKEFGYDLLTPAEKGLITVPKLMKILRDNMEDVNTSAATMQATFEQLGVKVFDAFKLKIFEVTQSFGGTRGLSDYVQLVVDKMGTLTSVFLIMTVAVIPALVSSIAALAASLGLVFIIPAAFAAITAAVLLTSSAFTQALDPVDQLTRAMVILGMSVLEIITDVVSVTKYLLPLTVISLLIEKGAKAASEALGKIGDSLDAKAVDLYMKKSDDAATTSEQWASAINKVGVAFNKQSTASAMLLELNKQYLATKITAEQYYEAVLKFRKKEAELKFGKGEADLAQRNDAIRKAALFNINRLFNDGTISVEKYSEAISKIKTDNLRDDLAAGSISLSEFDIKLATIADKFSTGGAFRAGIQGYLASIGTTTQQVGKLIEGVFTRLEDVMLEFIKKGTASFKDFTQAILDDLTRIAIRAAITAPLAEAAGVFFTSSAAPASAPKKESAHGNVFDMGIKRYAKGGVVGAPTLFKYGSDKTGLMGEAGPEAILPLKRGGGGDLGVAAVVTPVTINVINQSGNEVKQTETTGPNGDKIIDILITGKVKEAIVSGKFDKVFKQSYGMNRKGS